MSPFRQKTGKAIAELSDFHYFIGELLKFEGVFGFFIYCLQKGKKYMESS
jgi:hypothetical protein